MFETLKNTALFGGLGDAAVRDISEFSEKLSLADGDPLLKEGAGDNRDLYILVDGQVGVVGHTGGGHGNREVDLTNAEKELFGEIAWLLQGKRSADVVSLGKSELIRVDGAKLHTYLAAHPDIGFKVIERMAKVVANKLVTLTSQVKMVWSYAF
jgi:CRP-like cAMP-binding protein